MIHRNSLASLLATLLIPGCALAQSLLGVAADTHPAPVAAPAARVESISAPAAAPLVVMQCNPYIGGKFSERGTVSTWWHRTILPHIPFMAHDKSKDGPVTWETARRFAKIVATDARAVDVIGMEEVTMPDTPVKMQGFLREATGRAWEHVFESQGVPGREGSGLAVFYDPAKVELVESLGSVPIETLDGGYVAKFVGVLLRQKATGKLAAVACGKVVWDGAVIDGRPIDDARRIEEIHRLKSWLDEKLAAHPDAGRVIATDLNSEFGGPAYREMLTDYESGGDSAPTWNSRGDLRKRFDYVWYQAPAGEPHREHITATHRSAHFGSDHRSVWSEIDLGGAPAVTTASR